MKTMMMMIVSTWVFAVQSPQNFDLNIFVDFQKADYQITFDYSQKLASATSTITFRQTEQGYPLFDYVEDDIKSVEIDGVTHSVSRVFSPDSETSYRRIDTMLDAGTYTVKFEHQISRNIVFDYDRVDAAFWMSDLSDRGFLERYLPSNLEYDQFKMSLHIFFKDVAREPVIYTNGSTQKISRDEYIIDFPEHFKTSSIYFHATAKDRMIEQSYVFSSMDGKDIPVIVYSRDQSSVEKAVKRSKEILVELETNLGPWPHDKLLIYIAGLGGMEYNGATRTSMSALGHELIHSYYARGVTPADGNAGWLDEAIASWRDNDYNSLSRPRYWGGNFARHSVYRRTTDRRAYKQGARFIAFLNGELSQMGGLMPLLSQFFDKFKFQSINTFMFQLMLETYAGRSFAEDFSKYVYGGESLLQVSEQDVEENPMHPYLSVSDELNLL